MKYRMFILASVALCILSVSSLAFAEEQEECAPVEKKKIKVEGYFSKQFRKDRKAIRAEISEVGHVRFALRAYPMGDTSKSFAVGRCVPAYIARHVLTVADKYTSGIGSLTVQKFLPTHWIGVGATMFDEPSQQLVTEEQVKKLLNPDLTNEEFHVLYQEYTIQNDHIPMFGQQVPNFKKTDD
ncbi:MAG: hypothetical protein G3M78_03570 [Candidatus Nitrohelix vancouverensis]|uniref:Uncharacterized protein n=1 Tax=Candidatus Nitrohelix vancouverensis TaxID=2705534 RepID=A0A7T0C0X2_9BACT|nr:MAG: hypothetical protein G3M78_03570 [Candidatus Nitrohelix vancouverensis]